MESMEGFWEDSDGAARIQKEKSVLQTVFDTYTQLKEYYEEFEILVEYAEADDDEASAREANVLVEKFLNSFSAAEQKVLLSDEVDPNNAIVSINSGAGGK